MKKLKNCIPITDSHAFWLELHAANGRREFRNISYTSTSDINNYNRIKKAFRLLYTKNEHLANFRDNIENSFDFYLSRQIYYSSIEINVLIESVLKEINRQEALIEAHQEDIKYRQKKIIESYEDDLNLLSNTRSMEVEILHFRKEIQTSKNEIVRLKELLNFRQNLPTMCVMALIFFRWVCATNCVNTELKVISVKRGEI